MKTSWEVVRRPVRLLLDAFGYHVSRRHPGESGRCPFCDMKRFVPAHARPLVLDVGANVGQSVKRFKSVFPSSVIHSFEPSPSAFEDLKNNTASQEGVFAWNCAIGATGGKRVFLENKSSDMSSFLELGEAGWGKVVRREITEVTTIDDFLCSKNIEAVDILKSDTQGYEVEVFRGAERSMQRNQIGLIFFEFIFSSMYKNLPTFDEVLGFLRERGFILVSIYDFRYKDGLASWADVLVVNKDYYQRNRIHELAVSRP